MVLSTHNVTSKYVTIKIESIKYKYTNKYVMPKTTITLDAWKCFRCDYSWPNKRDKKPIRCPSCGTPYWDFPKKQKEEVDKYE